MLISWLWQVDRDRRLGISNKSKQNESIGFVEGLPKIIAEMLLPHKRLEFTGIHSAIDTY